MNRPKSRESQGLAISSPATPHLDAPRASLADRLRAKASAQGGSAYQPRRRRKVKLPAGLAQEINSVAHAMALRMYTSYQAELRAGVLEMLQGGSSAEEAAEWVRAKSFGAES